MEELKINEKNLLTRISSNEQQSSLFILQQCLTNDHPEENVLASLKFPLLISQIYEEEFFDRFHVNYFGDHEHEGLFLASIRSISRDSQSTSSSENNDEDNQLVRALIRTEKNNYDVSEVINIRNEEHLFQVLFEKCQLPGTYHYGSIHHVKANEKLLELDRANDDQYSIKVSLISQRLNQTTDDEILSNNEISSDLQHFLDSIGQRIELKDFHEYRADLDTKTNLHGLYSYFTKFENHQIMFNIAPIIPSDSNDREFLQRKSLIANAFLCIVFQERGTKSFEPNFMLGQVIQVYITIQPMEKDSELYYQIEIWRRSDIEQIVNPEGGIWKLDQSFRINFLRLILNTVNTILKKDFFQKRIIEPRQHIKSELIEKLCQFFYLYSKQSSPLSDNNLDHDINTHHTNFNKHTASKYNLRTVIPKIIATFSSNRPVSSPPTAAAEVTLRNRSLSAPRSPVQHSQKDAGEPIDAVVNLAARSSSFTKINKKIRSSTSTINDT